MELVRQRVFGIACGYEDLSDHSALRVDPLLAAVVGKADPTEPLASSSTLNRLELTEADATGKSRYRKVVYEAFAIENFFVDAYLDAHSKAPTEVVLDLDATDDPIHGTQEGRFFHGYYGNYCYLPLYIFAGDFLLCAKLRKADIDASAGALDEVKRIVGRIRARWPKTRFVLRADSGFARDALMTWCEENEVHFVFGLARNERLVEMISTDLELVRVVSQEERDGAPVRAYRELRYRTLDSWSCERRVVAKAEWLGDKHNPRIRPVSDVLEGIEDRAMPCSAKIASSRGQVSVEEGALRPQRRGPAAAAIGGAAARRCASWGESARAAARSSGCRAEAGKGQRAPRGSDEAGAAPGARASAGLGRAAAQELRAGRVRLRQVWRQA